MALSEEKIRSYIQRLLLSRMRILCNHGFYGLLLMHMVYAVDEEVATACTDGIADGDIHLSGNPGTLIVSRETG